MNLKDRARLQGIHLQTAYRWFREGRLPVPAVRVNSRSVLVAPDAAITLAQGGVGLYARVSFPDQKAGLDRQVARLAGWAAQSGWAVVLVEAALSAHGRRLAVLDSDEMGDDLVRDVTEVLTSFCARLYGRHSARNRTEKAPRYAASNAGPGGPRAVP